MGGHRIDTGLAKSQERPEWNLRSRLLWKESSDYALTARLCEKWNSGRLYEIFWEYADLRSRTLKEKSARSWLCYEDSKLSGFALGRSVKGLFVIEELWGQFIGLFGDTVAISEVDLSRVEAFRSQVLERIGERRFLIRGAMDNCFAHGVARALKLPWFNGLVLGERALTSRTAVRVPEGYALRGFRSGDEEFFERLYREVYSEEVSPREFADWATKDQCRTIIASLGDRPVGFVIAEKRPYNLLGDFAIAVSPRQQRRGVGGALLDAGLDALYQMGTRRVIADYRTLNGATHALYEGRGFKPKRVYNYFWASSS
jgi:GNAT superfamily N-acetyltransferase